jgi:2,4-dienoyl-CoA reductase-like NADH-dependent reductase (Old Yellow Enzyme family)
MSSFTKFKPFSYKSVNDLRYEIKSLKLKLPISLKVDILKEKIKLNNKVIVNRLAIQPMEGFDADLDGKPSNLTFRRYIRYANGGASLIWFEATAISENSRSNKHQLLLSQENLKVFKNLVSKTRDHANQNLKRMGFEGKVLLVLQLNHSGRYSKLHDKRYPIRGYYNSELDRAINVSEKDGKIISDEEIEDVKDLWVQKALLAKEAGFNGVDIKACHGYLISELLTARNRENSKYGGYSLENRSKLLFNIIKNVNKELGFSSNFFITTRLGIYDGVPYPNGFGVKSIKNEQFPASINITEPLKIIKKLYQNNIKLINLTAGNPHYKPHITRPYDTPIEGGYLPSEHPLISVGRLLNLVSLIKKKIPNDIVVLGSGYSYLRQHAGFIAAGLVSQNMVDICGFGRMAIANPDFPKQIFQNGTIDKNLACITCSKCSELMREGKNTGCVIRDPQYKN